MKDILKVRIEKYFDISQYGRTINKLIIIDLRVIDHYHGVHQGWVPLRVTSWRANCWQISTYYVVKMEQAKKIKNNGHRSLINFIMFDAFLRKREARKRRSSRRRYLRYKWRKIRFFLLFDLTLEPRGYFAWILRIEIDFLVFDEFFRHKYQNLLLKK